MDTVPTPKTEQPKGFDAPIPKGKGRLADHISPDTRMAKGIDPKTKEMITVNLETLQALHGKDEGFDRYSRIARAGGFFDPGVEPVGSTFFPDLQLEGMNKDAREEIEAILNEKE